MDRRAGVAVAVAGALAACGPPAPRAPAPDAPAPRVVARGTLAYAAAFADGRLVTVELAERFELVVRSADGARELGRVDLGPPERDWVALAARGDRAWVGGRAGVVVEIDLARGVEAARWPVGAPVTALAALPGHVAIGDAEGALCLRRGDGALLQCAIAHGGAVAALVAAGGDLVSGGPDGARRWTVPALAGAPADPADLAPRWRGAPLRADGTRVVRAGPGGPALVVALHGRVTGLAVAADGTLAITAWISSLDQPSVVLIPPG